jgi:hypothetical protein
MGASTLQNTLRDKCMALFLSEPYNEECNARMTSSATHARRNVLEVAFAECRLVAIRRWFPAEALPLAALKVWRAAFPDEIPLLPTDGISPERIAAYVAAGGGGWTLRNWPKPRRRESADPRLCRCVTRDIEQFTRNKLTRGRDSECT